MEQGGRLLAWLLSHPWRSFDPPTPDQVLAPGGDACWYIHDLSVVPEGRGLGLGRALVEHVVARCRPACSMRDSITEAQLRELAATPRKGKPERKGDNGS